MDLEKVKKFIEENKENEDVAEYLSTFTKVEGVAQEEYEAVVAERDELLKYKPKEVTEEEQALLDKQQELWQREVNLTLQEKGLHQFKDIISVSDEEGLTDAIKTLQSALKEYKVDNSYVPTDNNNTRNSYDEAKQKGDTQGMLKSLLGFR